MAEVTTWETRTTTRTGDGLETVTAGASVRVTSIVSERPDVSVLRDLVKALDAAGAPQTARVQVRTSEIVVEWRIHRPVDEECRDPGASNGQQRRSQ